MENELKQQLEGLAKEFFEKISLEEAKLEVQEAGENEFRLALDVEEPQLYIGERGVNLANIQFLLTLVARKKLGQTTPLFLDVDINGYKEAKVEYLKEMARSAAEDVALTKIERRLEPMNAYERRIVHAEVSLRDDVKTESVGEEPERFVVVKPKSVI